jgi:hypothetical protein
VEQWEEEEEMETTLLKKSSIQDSVGNEEMDTQFLTSTKQ